MDRRRRWLRGVVAATALCTATFSWGRVATRASPEQASRNPIFVSHSGQDAVGAQYVQHVKNAIARSALSSLSESGDDADVVLFVSTLDPDPARRGDLTAVGWSLVMLKDVKVYVGSGLRLCDRLGTEKYADALVTYVESLLKGREEELSSSAEHARYVAEWNQEVERVASTLPVDACGIKVRTAFREQLATYLRMSNLANLRLDVKEVVESVAANFTTDEEFARKIQTQASKLTECQAQLAAIKKR